MDAYMAKTDDAQRKKDGEKIMQDWMVWKEKYGTAIVDNGMPVGKTKRVTEKGVADARNEVTYVMVVQAENHEAAAALFAGHPHAVDGSYFDISEVPHIGLQ